jgi:hydrogenase maturation protease
MAKNYLTILGVGNILLQDEGFGVHFIRWIEERYKVPEGVSFIDGGTLSNALLDIICGCEHLIVIDTIKLNDEPGSIYRFTQEELETRLPPPTSAHEVSFPDVLFKAELMDELPETVFLCVVPQNYQDMGLELTPLLSEKIERMESLLMKELELLNVRLERK